MWARRMVVPGGCVSLESGCMGWLCECGGGGVTVESGCVGLEGGCGTVEGVWACVDSGCVGWESERGAWLCECGGWVSDW